MPGVRSIWTPATTIRAANPSITNVGGSSRLTAAPAKAAAAPAPAKTTARRHRICFRRGKTAIADEIPTTISEVGIAADSGIDAP